MINSGKRKELKVQRKARGRARMAGTAERPRVSVFRSARHVFVQVVDDFAGKTLASVGTQKKANSRKRAGVETCHALGKELAKVCMEKKIAKVVFDRNGNAYHGRIKALADGAREGGLSF
jgi:large subunit ribosomal protein L18